MTYEEILEKVAEQELIYKSIKAQTPYTLTKNKIKTLDAKIDKIKEQIKKLEDKAEKLSPKHYETLDKIPHGNKQVLLPLIAEELMKLNPNLKSYELMGCFGLNAECSIWFYETEEVPKDTETHSRLKDIKGSLMFHLINNTVWTGEKTNTYPVGSIGELNGDNYVMTKITSIEQLNELLQNSMKERGEM